MQEEHRHRVAKYYIDVYKNNDKTFKHKYVKRPLGKNTKVSNQIYHLYEYAETIEIDTRPTRVFIKVEDDLVKTTSAQYFIPNIMQFEKIEPNDMTQLEKEVILHNTLPRDNQIKVCK